MEDVRNLKIDRTDLDRELSEQASNFLYSAERHVAAEELYNDFKLKVDQLEAALDKEVRTLLQEKGEKFTEKMVATGVQTHPAYIKALAQLNKLKRNKEMLKANRDAWHMRKDCVLELARKDRDELRSMLSNNREVRTEQQQ